MYVCMYVLCMYVCMYVCMCVCVYIYVCMYVCVYIYVCMYACSYVFMYYVCIKGALIGFMNEQFTTLVTFTLPTFYSAESFCTAHR